MRHGLAREALLCAFVWASLPGCRSSASYDNTTDCDAMCAMGGVPGFPPVNACKETGGSHKCVHTCTSDADCDPNYFEGCTDRTDDGTMVCRPKPSEAWGDAGTDAGPDT